MGPFETVRSHGWQSSSTQESNPEERNPLRAVVPHQSPHGPRPTCSLWSKLFLFLFCWLQTLEVIARFVELPQGGLEGLLIQLNHEGKGQGTQIGHGQPDRQGPEGGC